MKFMHANGCSAILRNLIIEVIKTAKIFLQKAWSSWLYRTCRNNMFHHFVVLINLQYYRMLFLSLHRHQFAMNDNPYRPITAWGLNGWVLDFPKAHWKRSEVRRWIFVGSGTLVELSHACGSESTIGVVLCCVLCLSLHCLLVTYCELLRHW